MDVTEITQIVAPAPEPRAPDPPPAFTHCEECGAPVDHVQRYCVTCGAHRRHVADPAARYLSATTARARESTRASSAPPAARPRRSSGLGVAMMLAVIPVAVAVGVAVGRSSNNEDAKLIKELSRSPAQVAAASQATATSPSAAAAATSATGSKAKKHVSRSSTKGKSKHQATSSTSKAPSSLNGQASAAQKKQGQAIVNKLQNTNGTGYLNQLPSQVTVP